MDKAAQARELMAAAARLQAKGDSSGSRLLVMRARVLMGDAPSPSDPTRNYGDAIGPADAPLPPTPEEEEAQEREVHAAFESANPTLAGRYQPGDRLPRSGDSVMGQASGGRGAGARVTVQPYTAAERRMAQDTFGGTAASMMSGPLAAAGEFGGGITGANPSPSRAFLANDPLTASLPSGVLTGAGAVGDLGGMLLSGLGAGVSGAIGLGTEAVPGQSDRDELRLGNDLLGMATVAVPELAGASSVIGTGVRAGARAAPPAARAVPVAAAVTDDIPRLIARASGEGRGAEVAQRRLAVLAEVNPDAAAAVQRLGIELPADVLADNPAVRQFGGATRSVVGSEDAAAWESTIKGAIAKADEVMAALGGTRDLATISDTVKASLTGLRDRLRDQARPMYEAVTQRVGPRAPVDVSNVQAWIKGKIDDVGGVDRLPAGLRGFAEMVTGERPVTFAFLQQEKTRLGEAAYKPGSPYADVGTADARALREAMAEDQRASVAALGDDALRAEYEAAQALTTQQKRLEDQIVSAFGRDRQGSIGAALSEAMRAGARGNIAGLNRALEIIPPDLAKDALATALSTVTRSGRAIEPGFGFAEFAKTFGAIRQNGPVYNRIAKVIGEEGSQLLNDLLLASQRITEARGQVMTTGKANQARGVLDDAASRLVDRVLAHPVGKRAVQVATVGAAASFSPAAAMIAVPLVESLSRGAPKAVAAAGRMFRSDAFNRFAREAAGTANVSAQAVAALANHGAFRQWARAVSLPDARQWLMDAVKAAPAPVGAAAANSAQQPERRAVP